jgi:hypothetical protein
MNMFLYQRNYSTCIFFLRMKNGMSVQYGIELFPRMRLKRDVIFGFVDLWGELLSGIILLASSTLILSLEVARIQKEKGGMQSPPPSNRN